MLMFYVDIVAKLAEGTHPFSKKLEEAKRPVVVVGSECLQVKCFCKISPCHTCPETFFDFLDFSFLIRD